MRLKVLAHNGATVALFFTIEFNYTFNDASIRNVDKKHTKLGMSRVFKLKSKTSSTKNKEEIKYKIFGLYRVSHISNGNLRRAF